MRFKKFEVGKIDVAVQCFRYGFAAGRAAQRDSVECGDEGDAADVLRALPQHESGVTCMEPGRNYPPQSALPLGMSSRRFPTTKLCCSGRWLLHRSQFMISYPGAGIDCTSRLSDLCT